MNSFKLDMLICPVCAGQLTLTDVDQNQSAASTGTLLCDSCATSFPVVDGIPRFVPASNYADSFGFQWNAYALTQLDSHSHTTISKDRLFSVTGWPADMSGQTVLEAGSGAGRFTEVLVETGADVYSFDYSSAVEANNRSNGAMQNLILFQGDIFHIPAKDDSFDNVLCLGVIQHTPDPRAAFESLARKVKPGGRLAIDVYADTLATRMQWKYLLRPITTRMNQKLLYRIISKVTPPLVPFTILARRLAKRVGARFSPIVEYSHLGLKPLLNTQWAILDTFDMYSPAHDHPQTVESVRGWFAQLGFQDVEVSRGLNGVVGRGKRPLV